MHNHRNARDCEWTWIYQEMTSLVVHDQPPTKYCVVSPRCYFRCCFVKFGPRYASLLWINHVSIINVWTTLVEVVVGRNLSHKWCTQIILESAGDVIFGCSEWENNILWNHSARPEDKYNVKHQQTIALIIALNPMTAWSVHVPKAHSLKPNEGCGVLLIFMQFSYYFT